MRCARPQRVSPTSDSGMDFDDTPEEAAFRSEARAWLEQHATPRGEGVARAEVAPASHAAETERVAAAKQWQSTLAAHGWAGITWPIEYGGRGGTPLQQRIFVQEQARFEVPPGIFAQSIGMAGPTLIAHGTDEQRERFLAPMLSGEELWCQLFSEPGAGSDLASLATRAERDGDEFVVNGQKVWTSGAHYADWGMLLTRTDSSVPKHRGISYLLLDMRTPGIEIRPIRQITGSAHFNEVFLTDVRVPVSRLVGQVGGGWGVALTTLANERTYIARDRGDPFPALLAFAERFGRRCEPLVRQELAAVYTRICIMKYLSWRSQTAQSQGRPPGPETSVAKLAMSAHLERLGSLGVSLAGPAGTLLPDDDLDVQTWGLQLLNQWSSRIGGGTEQVQRNIVAERVLGLPADLRVDKTVPFRELRTGAMRVNVGGTPADASQ